MQCQMFWTGRSNHSVGQFASSIRRSAGQSVGRPDIPSVCRPINQSALRQSVGRSVRYFVRLSVDRSIGRSVGNRSGGSRLSTKSAYRSSVG